MSRRSGQTGTIEVKNGSYYGRFRVDIAGEDARKLRCVRLGFERELTRS
jgi:hypothetical protein